jgi:hypothetical protein
MRALLDLQEITDWEFDVFVAGDHIGSVWLDDNGTWVARENADEYGTDGFDTAQDAAEWMIGY